MDGGVGALFRDNGRLDVPINKAPSLRNILKAWFRADGRLQPGQTNAENLRDMCKGGLVQNVDEVFSQGVECGWLWLNASLSVGGPLVKLAHLCGWWPFVSRAIAHASDVEASVVLLGEWAKAYRTEVVAERLLETIHPSKQAFVEDQNMRSFLCEWTQLIHEPNNQADEMAGPAGGRSSS